MVFPVVGGHDHADGGIAHGLFVQHIGRVISGVLRDKRVYTLDREAHFRNEVIDNLQTKSPREHKRERHVSRPLCVLCLLI
jgi:hypothetical protein